MIIKNYLTKIHKKSLLRVFVVSVLPGIKADAMRPLTVFYCYWQNTSFYTRRGVSCVYPKIIKNFYAQFSTPKIDQKKDSSGKAVDNKIIRKVQSKSIKLIISNILGFVKSKFADTFFKSNTSQKVLAFE